MKNWTICSLASGPCGSVYEPLALPPDQTAIDPFTYTIVDAVGATSTTSLDITVSGGIVPPYINTSTHNFVTPSEPGQLVFINGFTYLRMVYASALSFVLFAILFVITIVLVRLHTRWVHYA